MNQILLTALVIAVVVVVLRMRQPSVSQNSRPAAGPERTAGRRWMPSGPAAVGYVFVLIMIVGATTVFYFQWREANRVVTIEVVDTRSGEESRYYVLKKDIGDREFRTVDGRYVSLGAADRMELVED